jgi:hypothetical protein
MNKNILVLFNLIIFSLIFPSFILAATPTINLEFFTEASNTQTGKLEFRISVNTTNVPDGTVVPVNLYKNGVKDGPTIDVTITNNLGQYFTGYVLDPATNYTVMATVLGVTANFARTTSGDPVPGVDPPVIVTPQKENSMGTYTLLAPIGTLTKAPSNFGDYVNIILKIAIGLCGVLAVIMLVIGGIEYMGDESVFAKTEARKQMINAIFGLLIALGAWALLNTINPDLLNVKVGIKAVNASINIEEENIATVGPGVTVDGTLFKITPGPATPCSTGTLVSITSGMGSGQICQDLLTKLTALKAETDKLGISWTITSTVRNGGTISSCHLSGNDTSGNCADIAITSGGDYSGLCLAIAKVGGLNFANEATNTGNCQDLKPYKTYSTTTGPHLHVNFIGS